jgi:hypothetical protein
MSRKCKRCGAWQECGQTPYTVYPQVPYPWTITPYPVTPYTQPTTWGGAGAGTTSGITATTWNA